MHRRLRVVSTVAVAAVSLAACGGSGGDNAALPWSSDASSTTAPAATASAAAAPGATVLSSYLGFWDALIAASKASDPALPALAAAAADPQLSRVRATLSRNKIQMLSLRGEVAHTPMPPAVSGSTATIEDCYDISAWDPVSLATGKPIEVTEEGGTGRYRARYTLRRAGEDWLVVDQKALGGC